MLLLMSGVRRAQAAEHLQPELFWSSLLAGARHDLGQCACNQRFSRAFGAVFDVLTDLGVLGLADLVAEVLFEVFAGFLATTVSHFLLLDVEGLMPRSTA